MIVFLFHSDFMIVPQKRLILPFVFGNSIVKKTINIFSIKFFEIEKTDSLKEYKNLVYD